VIVLDSSAAVDYLARLAPGDWVAERLLADPDLHAPHVLDVEVVAALRKLVGRGLVSDAGARQALDDLVELDVARYSHVPFLDRIWGLRASISASDAAFVALAEALGARVITTDLRLARAPGLRIDVEAP
jgi:predicted nucleic acid-binding protein